MTLPQSAYATHKVSPAPSAPAAEHDAVEVVRHLAHELRQPLSTMESLAYYLDIILPRGEVRARQQLEKMQQLVQQANWILNDSLHLLQAGPPQMKPVDLDELITQCLFDRARRQRLSVHLDLGPTLPPVNLDPEQARHLLQNLLHFFRQASNEDTTVSLRTMAEGDSVSLSFSCVVPASSDIDVASLFEAFSSHPPVGSGLSLASVRRIVEAHHGTLTALLGPDRLFSVTVSLPIASF